MSYTRNRVYQLVRPSNFNLQLIRGRTLSYPHFYLFIPTSFGLNSNDLSISLFGCSSQENIAKVTRQTRCIYYVFNFYFFSIYQTKYPMYLPFPIIFPLCLSLKIVELFGTWLSDLTKCGVPYTSARI